MWSGRLLGPPAALSGLRVDVEAELRGDDHLVARGLQGFADDAFGLERAVDLGGVEERHALVDGGADERDHVGAVGHRTV